MNEDLKKREGIDLLMKRTDNLLQMFRRVEDRVDDLDVFRRSSKKRLEAVEGQTGDQTKLYLERLEARHNALCAQVCNVESDLAALAAAPTTDHPAVPGEQTREELEALLKDTAEEVTRLENRLNARGFEVEKLRGELEKQGAQYSLSKASRQVLQKDNASLGEKLAEKERVISVLRRELSELGEEKDSFKNSAEYWQRQAKTLDARAEKENRNAKWALDALVDDLTGFQFVSDTGHRLRVLGKTEPSGHFDSWTCAYENGDTQIMKGASIRRRFTRERDGDSGGGTEDVHQDGDESSGTVDTPKA